MNIHEIHSDKLLRYPFDWKILTEKTFSTNSKEIISFLNNPQAANIERLKKALKETRTVSKLDFFFVDSPEYFDEIYARENLSFFSGWFNSVKFEKEFLEEKLKLVKTRKFPESLKGVQSPYRLNNSEEMNEFYCSEVQKILESSLDQTVYSLERTLEENVSRINPTRFYYDPDDI